MLGHREEGAQNPGPGVPAPGCPQGQEPEAGVDPWRRDEASMVSPGSRLEPEAGSKWPV